MHLQLCLSLLLLLYAPKSTESLSVYDNTGRFNLSASCPDAYCSLGDQSVAYSADRAVRLKELHLSNCSRLSVPWVVLNLTPYLSSLVIRNCSTYYISKESLTPVSNLSALQMQRTNLWVLRDEQFGTVPRLEMLELGHNTIHTVHVRAFKGLSRLRLLGLQSNGIGQILENTFDPLVELLHLDLSGNEIETLPGNIFGQNSKLQTLMLNGNRLTVLTPPTLGHLTDLRLLDLGHCGQLQELHLHSAHTLFLEGSGVTSLVIEGSVIRLSADNNELTHLSIADKSSVLHLHLHGNLLDGNDTDTLLRGMWNLDSLDLSKNLIEALPQPGNEADAKELFLLPSLRYLNLAYNRVGRLPVDSPLLSPRLNHLDLSHNHMLDVQVESLAGLQNLESLYLEGNRLNDLDYELLHSQHEGLKELGLNDNEWGAIFFRKMSTYLTDRGVFLPPRGQPNTPFNNTQLDMDWPTVKGQVLAQKRDQAGVAGIHPYWTLRDVLAMVTMLVVLLILLLHLYRILQEEGCFRRYQRWRRPERSASGVRRLNEQDSEQSSSE
ncbi:insulin-like growth factor-binding protein complex acid labile subunit isoform X1 [Drosophila guanche]|uniref:Blast:Carboxypeptidase N subunit 2 n=1 Tax=Drosophila guanche TaxID=7266 RepID=A0A3B0KNJ3_DROGU|nr:insulin-like growth factor-binding protein complex acid labile subunit isoform X1 [Drosophila guanche]SPP88169.1 blast:Carboxypeptidase N subunit 2 [Drosophila guanche]